MKHCSKCGFEVLSSHRNNKPVMCKNCKKIYGAYHPPILASGSNEDFDRALKMDRERDLKRSK